MEPGNEELIRQLHAAAGRCLEREDYAGAVKNLEQAMALLSETALSTRAVMFNNIGHARVGLEHYDAAALCFQNAADLFSRIGNKIGVGEQTGNIGSAYRDQERWDDSLAAYFQALEIFREENHERGIADQLSNIAYSVARKGDVAAAVRYFDEAKKLYDKLGDQEKSALCEQNLQNFRTSAGE